MIQASIGPRRVIFGTTCSRTLASICSSTTGVGDEVQELLMLHLNVRRIRHHRDRLHAAPAFRPSSPEQ